MVGKLFRKMARSKENGKTTKLIQRLAYLVWFKVLLLHSPFLTLAQASYSDSLDIALTANLKKSGLPGCSVVIVSKDAVLYQKALGFADIKNKKPFSLQTTINIASVSKTFIAIALLKAIELDYFNLETPINQVLPFKVSNPYFPNDTIRIKHLVTHTSGIIDNNSIYPKCYQFLVNEKTEPSSLALIGEAGVTGGLKDTSLGSFMVSYLHQKGNLYSKANFYKSKAGKRYNYSNIAAALAAYLIEVKSPLSFSAFTQQYIFRPLQMNQANWYMDPNNLSNRAIPYYSADTRFPFYSLITYPDGGLVCSAEELSLFVQEMIRTRNGSPLLLNRLQSKQLFNPFFSKKDKITNYNLKEYNNSVFWEVYPDGFIGHSGADPGVSTFICFNKEVGIIFMGNRDIETEDFEKLLKKFAVKMNRKN